MRYAYLLIPLVITLAGCSDFQDPTKKLTLESVVTGGDALNQGMTKDQVIAGWGHPDRVKSLGQTKWGAPIEEWSFYAWLPKFPVNFHYVSKGRRLVFEGDALVRWEEIEIKENAEVESVKADPKAPEVPGS